MAIPAMPTSKSGLRPTLSIISIDIIVNTSAITLNNTPCAKAALVPIPVCLKIEVA